MEQGRRLFGAGKNPLKLGMVMSWAQRVVSAVAGSAALVFTTLSEAAAAANLPSESLAALAAEVTPAIVNISTHRAVAMPVYKPSGQSADRQTKKISQYLDGFASGFIIDPSGYIVTSNHVIADAEEIQITHHLAMGDSDLGIDPNRDIGVGETGGGRVARTGLADPSRGLVHDEPLHPPLGHGQP
jgi:S1-C subfamily serine protease